MLGLHKGSQACLVYIEIGGFTPVCTTELMTFASMASDFSAHNCSLLGISIDSNPSHIAWSRAMEGYQWKNIRNPQITFPIVADDMGTVAKLYGMLMPTASPTRTVRNVFYIDPEGTVRAILVYPLTTGRNTSEIMRLLLALQEYDRTGKATPCNWEPGEPVIMPSPQTLPGSEKRLAEQQAENLSCLDWYICFTQGAGAAGTSQPAGTAAMPSAAPAAMPQQTTRSQDTMDMQMPTSAPAATITREPQGMAHMQAADGNRQFTPRELARYNGKDGMPAYAAVDGKVYDIGALLSSAPGMMLRPGTDMTRDFMGMSYLLNRLPVVGTMTGTESAPGTGVSTVRPMAKQMENDYQILRDFPLFRE